MIRTRVAYEQEERERLAPVAVKSAETLGRVDPEPEHPYRTAFQRDRDRVIHARAFRRLEYKTQVFVYSEGDHYRNRLTHSLEAAQIARTIARALRLNEDLTEAIILAHDLGHTPFGHAGERALHRLLEDEGGFDHNRQSLRIVDFVEERASGQLGLNLTHDTREGILKHGHPWSHPVPFPPAGKQPSLEAQLCDLADEIAYNNHDLDDGLRSGLITVDQLAGVQLWTETRERLALRHSEVLSDDALRARMVRALIDRLVTDLIETTAQRVAAAGVQSAAQVRAHSEKLAGASDALRVQARELKRFLYDHFYQHPRVMRMTRKAEQVLSDLYRAYRADPQQLPDAVRARFAREGEARAIADYIAGMTDRFALEEHKKMLDPHVCV